MVETLNSIWTAFQEMLIHINPVISVFVNFNSDVWNAGVTSPYHKFITRTDQSETRIVTRSRELTNESSVLSVQWSIDQSEQRLTARTICC